MARLPDGRTAFVSGSVPDDEVSVHITEDHGRWVRAAIDEIITPSPDRIAPPCPYFGQCGGCQWQHVSYERQLAEKHRILSDTLTRIGRLESPEVAEVIPSPSDYGYRNKVELSVSGSGTRAILGFTRAGTHDVLPVERCMLLPKAHAAAPKALAGALRFMTSRGASGVIRASLRVSASGETAVDVRTAPGPFPRALAARVLSEATRARSVTRSIVKGGTESRDVTQVETLSGPGHWSESLDEDRYRISPPSFFQVNTRATSALRSTALAALGLEGTDRVADLYAGAGTFTLPMARVAGEVVAVEASRYALADLRENLEVAGLDADVVPGDAAYALPELGHLDAALIDPPRAGLSDDAMRALVSARIQRIVYVSCDPATLARDVLRLGEGGYHAVRLVPVDLFPQTYHLETVALLERVGA